RARLVWITMRCAVGQAGIGISPWPCGPMRGARCGAQSNCPRRRHKKKRSPSLPRAAWQPSRRREACCSPECGGDSLPLLAPCAGHPAPCRAPSRLVEVAPLAPRHRQILALQATRRFITTTVVLEPVTDVEPGIAKQPAEVVLRLIAMVETLRKMGRIPRTSRGRPTRPFLSKLTKMLGWEAAPATDALAPLPNATLFFFWLLAGLGFYQPLPDGTDMELISETTTFFEASYETQAARWVCAYRPLTGWVEHRPEAVWGDDTEAWYFNKFIGLRAALLLALAALPDATAWYRIADLSAGLYSRLGEHFSLGYLPHFY